MATNDIHLSVSDNNVSIPLTISGGRNLRTVTPQNGSPYYVGARAYVTQTENGATVTVIDKDGTTTAVITNGTDGTDGADGNGIASIDLTSTVGNVDTYTITYTDGTTDTFEITNGVDGQDGTDGVDGADGYSPTATVTKSGDTATITITDKDGTTTATVKDGTQANAFTAEFGTTTYADVKDAYDNDAILICTVDDSGNTVVLQLVYFDATNEIFYFAEPNGDGWYWTELSNANGWDDGTRYLASTDVATQLADGLMSALDKQKLDGIASGAEVNVQSDWSQSVNTADDYIKNKPAIHNVPSGGSSGQVLSKASGTDYDLAWATPSSGSVTDVEVDGTSVVTGGVAEIDLTGKSDVGHTHTTSAITDFPSLATVATSGDYDDLTDKPTIPSNVSDLVNDSGFITSPNVVYCTCATEQSTVAKVATIVSGSLTTLTTGTQAIVKFTNANAATNPTLQVGSTAAKSIKRYGTSAPSTSSAGSWNGGSCILFIYDGTYWQMAGWLNSTYSEISSTNIKSSSSSTTGLISGRRAKAAVDEFAPVKDVTVGGTSVMSGTTAVVPAIPTVPTNLSGFTDDISTATPTASTVSKFDSSAHINSEDMSAQDVSDFVDGLDGQGANLADYIVEQGTSGIWTYRKWNSGIAECWGKTEVESYTYAANGGSKAVVEYVPSGLFISNPTMVETRGYIATNVRTITGFSYCDTSYAQTYLINNDTTAKTQGGGVYWNIRGRWK